MSERRSAERTLDDARIRGDEDAHRGQRPGGSQSNGLPANSDLSHFDSARDGGAAGDAPVVNEI